MFSQQKESGKNQVKPTVDVGQPTPAMRIPHAKGSWLPYVVLVLLVGTPICLTIREANRPSARMEIDAVLVHSQQVARGLKIEGAEIIGLEYHDYQVHPLSNGSRYREFTHYATVVFTIARKEAEDLTIVGIFMFEPPAIFTGGRWSLSRQFRLDEHDERHPARPSERRMCQRIFPS